MDKKGSYPKHDQKPSNITDFYDTWDSSLSLLKEHIQNMIKNPGPSQEHQSHFKHQQIVIILQEGF